MTITFVHCEWIVLYLDIDIVPQMCLCPFLFLLSQQRTIVPSTVSGHWLLSVPLRLRDDSLQRVVIALYVAVVLIFAFGLMS